MRVEICVDSVAGAVAAERGGADRVELCANLFEGGTTPSAGCLKIARSRIKIGIQVLIRPRAGDFLYSEAEVEVIREDIHVAHELGADGIVVGCLTQDGDVDRSLMAAIIGWSNPLPVTFHRAFDMCRDPRGALETLVELGVARILTSGQEASCIEGLELIAELQKLAADRIIVMPGGGVTPANCARIVRETGVGEIHLSARGNIESGMKFRNGRCFMGGSLRQPEFSWKATDETVVRSAVTAVRV